MCVFGCSTLVCRYGSQITGFPVGNRDMESAVLVLTSGFLGLADISSLLMCVYIFELLQIGKLYKIGKMLTAPTSSDNILDV